MKLMLIQKNDYGETPLLTFMKVYGNNDIIEYLVDLRAKLLMLKR